MMIIEREFLLPMRRVIRVIQIEDNGGWGLRIAGDEVIHEGLGEAIQVFAIDTVLQPRKGGRTGEILRRLQGAALEPEFEQGVTAQTIGVVAVGIARGNLIDTLGEEVPQRMINIGRMPLIVDSGGETLSQPDLAVDSPQQEGTKVRRQRPTLEISSHRLPGDRRKAELFWVRIEHKQTSCGFYGMDASHIPFYQRLTRGLCFFMKNSG
jgi:hypothetical protein